MNKKLKTSIYLGIFFTFTIILVGVILRDNKIKNGKVSDEYWVSYFAPSYTNIIYGKNSAKIIKFDKLGNFEVYEEKAYPFSSLLNYKDKILYQNNEGIANLNSKENMDNITENKNTIGYELVDILENKDLFYFLLNESFKDDYYSSNIIIGNDEKQTLHGIEGFVNAYGDDEESIYLITSDMKNKYLKQVQKISVNGQENITINKKDIVLDSIISSDNKVIIVDGYIYYFCIKENQGVSMLKISANTLELESVVELVEFDYENNNDKWYPLSQDSIFYNEEKIYYAMLSGEIYSYDIKTNNFIKEFKIEDYYFNVDSNIRSFYNDIDSEIYFLYYENEASKYSLSTYSLEGDLKNKFYLDNLKIETEKYPHSFIKSK